MPEFGPLIADFQVGASVYDVPVYIQEATTRTKKDGAAFGGYTLKDRSGSIAGVNWNQAPAEGEQGAVALVRGRVGLFRETPQLTVEAVEVVANPDRRLIARLREPEDTTRRDWLLDVMEGCRVAMAPSFWSIFKEALGHDPFDLEGPFWTWAAGEKMHHADPGGLAWHVLTMLSHVDTLAPSYPGLDVDLLKLAVLTHDIGKLDCYEMSAAGARQLSLDRNVGHTTYSMARVLGAIDILREDGYEITAEDEENLMHCIASHHGKLEWGAVREPDSVEAHALHALDSLDSQIRGGLDNRNTPPPDRGGKPAAKPAAPAEPAADPFTVDNDDPFDDDDSPPPPAGGQPTLF